MAPLLVPGLCAMIHILCMYFRIHTSLILSICNAGDARCGGKVNKLFSMVSNGQTNEYDNSALRQGSAS